MPRGLRLWNSSTWGTQTSKFKHPRDSDFGIQAPQRLRIQAHKGLRFWNLSTTGTQNVEFKHQRDSDFRIQAPQGLIFWEFGIRTPQGLKFRNSSAPGTKNWNLSAHWTHISEFKHPRDSDFGIKPPQGLKMWNSSAPGTQISDFRCSGTRRLNASGEVPGYFS